MPAWHHGVCQRRGNQAVALEVRARTTRLDALGHDVLDLVLLLRHITELVLAAVSVCQDAALACAA